MKKNNKNKIYNSFNEDGITYMQCKSCNEYTRTSEDSVSVVCGTCNAIKIAWPKVTVKKESTGRPAGWHWMSEFVDKDGNVFHKGKEQPKLKGTLPPTKVKPPKKRKKKKDRFIKLANDYKKKQKLKKQQKG
mgnify:CR=1 FL=1|tara:strand:- start:643 stop:1038 length:396 start_codon:yes stop_codon:yes gene_type:complete